STPRRTVGKYPSRAGVRRARARRLHRLPVRFRPPETVVRGSETRFEIHRSVGRRRNRGPPASRPPANSLHTIRAAEPTVCRFRTRYPVHLRAVGMNEPSKRVALVTGATGGIGRVVARRLGSLGWSVAVTGRNRERGRETVREVEGAGGESQFFRADLAETDTVSALAEAFCERYDRLDVLVNNAACSTGERRLTEDGHEMAFAVNHLAPYRLTHDLLGMLRESAPARVVNTSSTVHRRGEIDFTDLRLDDDYEALAAYARSTFATLL